MSLVDAETGEVVEILDAGEAVTLAKKITAQNDRVNIEAGALVELVADALKGKAWIGLGYGSWSDLVDAMGWEFRPATTTDRAALGQLLRDSGMSYRAIGKVVGVNDRTIRRDLAGAANAAGVPLGTPVLNETPDGITGIDGKTYPAKNTTREGVGGDGDGSAGDASNGDGADSHDVGQLDPEPTPVDPAPSPGAENGEVEAATDGDEVESSAGPSSAATSPKSRLVTVHDFLKPVTSYSWLTGVDPAVFWDLDNPQAADTFLAWIDSMTAYAVTLRDNKPNHLRLVEGNA